MQLNVIQIDTFIFSDLHKGVWFVEFYIQNLNLG